MQSLSVFLDTMDDGKNGGKLFGFYVILELIVSYKLNRSEISFNDS